MKQYICVEGGEIYDENTVPSDYVCKDPNCPGGGLTGLIIEMDGNVTQKLREAGLCVLLMDASGSMADEAYKGYNFSSKYEGKLSKREAIADVAAAAIFQLQMMTKADDAYICAIKFDDKQAVMFTKTVSALIEEFKTPHNLAKYLYDELSAMNGGTDINSALKLAHSFIEKFLNSTVPGMGNYTPIYHTQYSTHLNKSVDVPNVRVLLYTDGEQLPDYGEIINPFKSMVPDLLMGAYIGQIGDRGCADLRSITSRCIIHGTEQFFVLDSPQKITTLRGLFRMASGTSGFCPNCIGSTLR